MGALLVGDLTEAARLHELIRSGEDIAPELLEGVPSAVEAGERADDVVCSCETVSRTMIERAIRQGGLRTVEEVSRATGASTGCGACRPQVSDMLATADDEAIEELRALRAAR